MPKLRLATLLALVLAAVLAPAASAAGLAGTQRVLAKEMAGSGPASGAYVIDLDTGAELFSANPDVPRIPASTNKLFTTSTALQRFGPTRQLTTTVLADAAPDPDGLVAGNVYLRGGGDPTFAAPQARIVAQRLAAAGVTRITGRVIGDESGWDSVRGGPASSYRTSAWVGPLSALTFNRGLTGKRSPYFQSNPPWAAAVALTGELKKAGVTVKRGARAGVAPPAATQLDTWESPTMAQIVAWTNTPSDNFLAESLLKAIGAEFGVRGSTASGATVVRATVEKLGARPKILDGSGLSRGDRTTPRDLVALIRSMDSSAVAQPFEASLPVAGRTGTLEKRLERRPAYGAVRAKTGTTQLASALSGFVRRRYAFAIVQNGNPISTWWAREAQDRFAIALAGS